MHKRMGTHITFPRREPWGAGPGLNSARPAQRDGEGHRGRKDRLCEALSDVSGEVARRGGEDWFRLHSKGSRAWGPPVGQPGGRGATEDNADVGRRDSGDGGEDRPGGWLGVFWRRNHRRLGTGTELEAALQCRGPGEGRAGQEEAPGVEGDSGPDPGPRVWGRR